MNNLVIFLIDKKLLAFRFLTTTAVHSAEFMELVALTCSYFEQKYKLR